MRIVQTDLRQTGMAIIEKDKDKIYMPLLTLNYVKESQQLLSLFEKDGYKLHSIVAFEYLENILEEVRMCTEVYGYIPKKIMLKLRTGLDQEERLWKYK